MTLVLAEHRRWDDIDVTLRGTRGLPSCALRASIASLA